MATIDDIATWCTTTMLKRDDLTSEARVNALAVYKTICQKVPFEQLQDTLDMAVASGTALYDLSAMGIAGIMHIQWAGPDGRQWRIKKSHVRVFDSYGPATSGPIRLYARRGKKVQFRPTPNVTGNYVKIFTWLYPTIVASPNEHTTTLAWPDAWDDLAKWETLYRLYFITGQEEKARDLIMPMPMPRQYQTKKTRMFEVGIIPRLWNDLLMTVDQREAVDDDFSVNPIKRLYTNA